MALDQGAILSDERARRLMRRLEETYNEAYLQAIENNKKAIEKYASLTDEALKDLTPEARKLKREAFKREIARTKALSESIAAEIANAGKTAAAIIQGEMTSLYGLNYDWAAYDIQRQSGLDLSFAQYDRNQLTVLMQENQSPFTEIAYKKMGKDADIVRRLQNQFMQGIMLGESQQKLIRRIKAVTGQSTSQAKRVAQTERNRVQSQARNQAIHEAAEMGLGMQKQWLARRVRTRDLHADSDLEIVAHDEKFNNGLQFPGDPNGKAANVINCFCQIKPMVKTSSKASAASREKWEKMDFERYQRSLGK